MLRVGTDLGVSLEELGGILNNTLTGYSDGKLVNTNEREFDMHGNSVDKRYNYELVYSDGSCFRLFHNGHDYRVIHLSGECSFEVIFSADCVVDGLIDGVVPNYVYSDNCVVVHKYGYAGKGSDTLLENFMCAFEDKLRYYLLDCINKNEVEVSS